MFGTIRIDGYRKWLVVARRLSARADEAEDLLQDALLSAIQAGRRPLDKAGDAPWFHGVIRNLAAMRARQAVRERLRETLYTAGSVEPRPLPPAIDSGEIERLPVGLRRVLVLALSGLGREEIRQVLGISDTALRQRLSALRKRLAAQVPTLDPSALAASYAARLEAANPAGGGLRRAALARGPSRLPRFRFGVADPDGNTIAVSGPAQKEISERASQNDGSRQQARESAQKRVDESS